MCKKKNEAHSVLPWASDRLRTFLHQCAISMSADTNAVSTIALAVGKLEKTGFYWGAITGIKAKALLRDQAVGTFLVRDSSDSRHLFTVSLVTSAGITNVRIVFLEGLFYLDKKDKCTTKTNKEFHHRGTPKFDCVVKMVFYYMLVTRKILQESERTPLEALEKTETATFFLWSPLYKEVSSLQHLCRKALNNQLLTNGVKDLPRTIPHTVQFYLSQYPYPI